MEVENHPTLEELANGQNGSGSNSPGANGGGGDAVDGTATTTTTMPAPPIDDQRLKKKARRLIRTGSREGHPGLVIPGQANAFIAPQRR